MKTRLLAALLAAVMSLTLLVGCEGNGGKTTTAATTTTTEETTTTTEETTTTTEETTTTTEEETTTTSKRTTTKRKTTTTTAPTTKWTFVLKKTTTTEETTTTDAEETTTVEGDETTTTSSTKRTVGSRTSKTTKDWSDTFPVKVNATAEERAAAINNDLKGKEKIKIKSDRATVFAHDHDGYSFTHHPGIALIDGRLFVQFTQSKKDEDAPGQRIVVSYSDDFFTWSDPVVAGPCQENTLVPGTETGNVPSSFYAHDGSLFLFYAARNYAADKFDSQNRFIANANVEGVDTNMFVKSDDKGLTWSEPIVYGSALGKPVQSLTGRWVSQIGRGISWLDDGEEANGLYWSHRSGLTAEQNADANSRVKEVKGTLTEASMYQTQDYVFHIMTRSDAGYLWHHESLDNGETWEDIYPTNFTTSSTMWRFGNLPDGRIFGIGSSDIKQGRYPLELWVSDDGINFDTCYILRDEYDIAETGELFVQKGQNQHCAGWAKGGEYAYPHVVIDDTYLYVTYSRHKEMMEITRVKLSDIQ
ncbi:MAG: exo-alpha-sialidase [Clostridia bacterium]|nr:exo-alpha-sialidase [Clostridia bacterium]